MNLDHAKRLWPDYSYRQQWEAGVDADFDGFGGELTFVQMCHPQFELYASPRATVSEYQRLPSRRRDKVERELDRIRDGKKPRVKDHRCCLCIPYNGRHTTNYWNTGQKEIW